jgi:hypothetical protein
MKNWGAFAIALGFVWTTASAEPTSISEDETAIYETLIASWLDGNQGHQLVDERLSARPDPNLEKCTKDIDFPTTSTEQGQKSLTGVQFKAKGIDLIDGSSWSAVDPSTAIFKNGRPVDEAVSEGFAHSLISFSQITFSRDGKDALVKFSMVCGSLCGTGSTMHMQRARSKWVLLKRCGGWVS